MDVVYSLGQASALQVMNALSQPPSKTAVRTHLRILEEKGHLSHVQEGQTYFYQSVRPRSKAGKSALSRVLSTFFENSLEQAVAAHLGPDGDSVSEAELERISKLITQAKRNKKS